MTSTTWLLLAAFALDLCLGDPRWLPHPVRGFGRLVERLETQWRQAGRLLGLRLAGAGFALTAIGGAVTIVWLTLRLASPWEWAAAAVTIYWIYSMLAVRDLDLEAGAVIARVREGDLTGARRLLRNIVGRDTENLDEPEILRAVLETVAENLNDAVVAPLFYFGLAGPAGMAAYKAANTLDSTAGYKNDRYREFGWASARLDDLLNLAPARISAALIWIAAGLAGLDLRRSVKAVWRDAARQPSPNAGYPEAALAGALGLRLGGVNFYGGVAYPKPWLGEPVRPICAQCFQEARKVLYGSSALMVVAVVLALEWTR